MVPEVSIIIPVWNQWALTRRCLETLAQHTSLDRAEVIVINNGSQDETTQGLTQLPGPWMVHHNLENVGFARACNQGARWAKAPVLLFLNNDTELHAGWLTPLLQALAECPQAAIVGSLLVFPDGRIQHAGVALANGLGYPLCAYHLLEGEPFASRPTQRRACSAVTAACVAVRRGVFVALDGFDEGYINGYEDIDLCLRARAGGHEVLLEPHSVLTHVTSASEGRFAREQHNIDRFHAKWLGRIPHFDKDLRDDLRAAKPLTHDANRPGITVVSVVLPGSLSTLAPWLLTTQATLGTQDTWLIINAGADDTAKHYAAWLASEAQASWIPEPRDFEGAWQAALQRAQTGCLAFVAPVCVPSWHWLDRAAAQLEALPELGLVVAALPPLGTCGPALDALDVSVLDHALEAVVEGQREGALVPETLCCVGKTDVIKRARLSPERSHDFGPALAAIGAQMATALDLWVRRLAAPARPAHVLEGSRQMLAAQAANRAWEAHFDAASGARASAPLLHKLFGVAPRCELVSVIVPVLNQPALTQAFLASLYAHTHRDFEVVLVDNGSGPEISRIAQAFAQRYGNLVYVRNQTNQGFGYACNQGLLRSQGTYLVVINNDVQVPPDWLSRMLAVFDSDPGVGVVGPMTNRCVGLQQIQPTAYAHASQFPATAAARALTHRGATLNVGRLVGLCLLMKRDVIQQIGGFDPAFGYGNFEDDDFCLRARRAGFRLAVAEDVLLHHEGSATFTGAGFDARALAQQNWKIFCHKWHHEPSNNHFQQLEALATEEAFDSERDSIPLDFTRQFRRDVDPLPLHTDKALRFLLVPDLDQQDWLVFVRTYLSAFTAHSPVALVIRPRPPTADHAQTVVQKVSALLDMLESSHAAPQVILETSWLAPQAQARLYAAMSACIRSGGRHEPFVARECEAMGLPTVEASAEAMLAFVAASLPLQFNEALGRL